MTDRSYQVRVSPEAARQIRKLDQSQRASLNEALQRLARDATEASGARGGKSLKRIRGRRDRFFRLRLGELRVLFEVLKEEQVLLVAGVINRRDLERWLRSR